jgi:hypothetical protein
MNIHGYPDLMSSKGKIHQYTQQCADSHPVWCTPHILTHTLSPSPREKKTALAHLPIADKVDSPFYCITGSSLILFVLGSSEQS